ncbi:MAG: AEC family transporter [Hyphomicrobiales bacterium]|nr:MAG: AEC family transporter [Hyphomicrobiales bacterium]
MEQLVEIILPVFGLIGLGYAIAAFGILRKEVGEALGDFVFTVAVPLLIFRTLATAHLPAVSPWALWIPYFAAVVVVWTLADRVVRLGFGRDARAGVVGGVSAGFSNLVLIGIPLILTAFGEAGSVPLFILISVHLPVMMVASTLLIERVERRENQTAISPLHLMRSIGLSLVSNPIVIGIIAGGLWRLAGLPVEGLPKVLIDKLAATAAPCALFALGMALKRYGIGGNLAPSLVLSVLKVGALPALVWTFTTYLTDLPPLWVSVATIAAACPTGVNAYLIANRFRTGHGLASNTITVTNAISVVAMAAWMQILPMQ